MVGGLTLPCLVPFTHHSHWGQCMGCMIKCTQDQISFKLQKSMTFSQNKSWICKLTSNIKQKQVYLCMSDRQKSLNVIIYIFDAQEPDVPQ